MNKQQRPRRNADQWQEIITHQKASGESVSAYVIFILLPPKIIGNM